MGTDGGQTLTRGSRGVELLGELDRTLDDRGRLSIPTAFRWAFDDGVVLLPWPGPCIALLPLDRYIEIEDNMRVKQRERLGDSLAREALNSLASHVHLDAQGRVFIRPDLKAHAGFDNELVVVGQHQRLELWHRPEREPGAAERWQALVAHIDAEAV